MDTKQLTEVLVGKIHKHKVSKNYDKMAMYAGALAALGVEIPKEFKAMLKATLPGYSCSKNGVVKKPNGRYYIGAEILEEVKTFPYSYGNFTGHVLLTLLKSQYPWLGSPEDAQDWDYEEPAEVTSCP